MPLLTENQIKEIITTYKTDRSATNKSLSSIYGVTEETVRKYTSGLVRDEEVPQEEESHEAVLEKRLHIEYLEALKDVGINPKLVAEALKKMFDSSDPQDIKEAVKEYHKVAGVYSKERTATEKKDNSGGGTNRIMYNLRLPKRDDS